MSGEAIAIVIPVFNGGRALGRCLDAIARLSPAPAELIVVNDGSSDGSEVQAHRAGVRLLSLPQRSGPAAARNFGARAASAPLLLFIDADVLVEPDLISRVSATFADAPGLAALFGSYDASPDSPGFVSQYKNLFHHFTHQQASAEAFTFWGACGAVRRELFLRVGGFDERYNRPCVEDIELGYRLRAAGERIRLHHTLQVKHLKVWRARGQLRCDLFDRAIPWTELLLRRGPIEPDLNLRYATRFGVALGAALLVALALAPWSAIALPIAAALLVTQLLLDLALFRFFVARRGVRFAAGAILWHRLYYWICGLGFAGGLARHLFRSGELAGKRPAAESTRDASSTAP